MACTSSLESALVITTALARARPSIGSRIEPRGIGGIEQHQVDIPMEREMLKPVVEDDAVDRKLFQYPSTERRTIGPDRYNGVRTAPRNQIGLVAGIRWSGEQLPSVRNQIGRAHV